MANNSAGTKLGAASGGQNPNLKTGVIHGGRSLQHRQNRNGQAPQSLPKRHGSRPECWRQDSATAPLAAACDHSPWLAIPTAAPARGRPIGHAWRPVRHALPQPAGHPCCTARNATPAHPRPSGGSRPGHQSRCGPACAPTCRGHRCEPRDGLAHHERRQPVAEVWINPPENRPQVRTLELPRDSKFVPQVSQSH